ncbi:MAG: hypothetical protein PHD02_02965 [Bacilli bacterium]|nr:hypothetical protein [Bacilli bacterium]
MKRVKFLFIAMSLFLLSGCMKASVNVDIKKDDTGSVTYKIAYDKAAMEEYEMDTDEMLGEIDSSWTEQGATVTDNNYEEDGVEYVGRQVTFNFNSLEELNTKLQTLESEEEEDTETTNTFMTFTRNKDVVTISMPKDEESSESIGMMASMITYTISIKVDGKVLENNADSFDKETNTLTWNYTTFIKEGITASYNTSLSSNNWIVYIIGLGAIVLLTIGSINILKNKQKKA